MARRTTLLTWLALATVYVVWGSTYLAIRVMVETIPPLLGAGVRFFLAGAFFAPFIALRDGAAAFRIGRRELAVVAGVAALLLAGGNGGVTIAEQAAPSGLAALVIGAVPLWVVVLRLLVRERVSAVTLGGVALGFVGVALLVVPGDRPDGAPLWSVLLLVASALSWATGSFVSGRARLPANAFVSTALQMLAGGSILVFAGLAAGEAGEVELGEFSLRSAIALAYLVFAGSLLAFTAYVWLLKNAPVSTVATYAFVNPLVAVALGWAVLSESVTWPMVGAAAAIVASVALVVRTERRPQSPRAAASHFRPVSVTDTSVPREYARGGEEAGRT